MRSRSRHQGPARGRPELRGRHRATSSIASSTRICRARTSSRTPILASSITIWAAAAERARRAHRPRAERHVRARDVRQGRPARTGALSQRGLPAARSSGRCKSMRRRVRSALPARAMLADCFTQPLAGGLHLRSRRGCRCPSRRSIRASRARPTPRTASSASRAFACAFPSSSGRARRSPIWRSSARNRSASKELAEAARPRARQARQRAQGRRGAAQHPRALSGGGLLLRRREVRRSSARSTTRTRARASRSNEGDRVIVSQIVIQGNVITNDSVIRRRVALKVGEPFRTSDVRKTQERIATLNVFTSVSVVLAGCASPAEEEDRHHHRCRRSRPSTSSHRSVCRRGKERAARSSTATRTSSATRSASSSARASLTCRTSSSRTPTILVELRQAQRGLAHRLSAHALARSSGHRPRPRRAHEPRHGVPAGRRALLRHRESGAHSDAAAGVHRTRTPSRSRRRSSTTTSTSSTTSRRKKPRSSARRPVRRRRTSTRSGSFAPRTGRAVCSRSASSGRSTAAITPSTPTRERSSARPPST